MWDVRVDGGLDLYGLMSGAIVLGSAWGDVTGSVGDLEMIEVHIGGDLLVSGFGAQRSVDLVGAEPQGDVVFSKAWFATISGFGARFGQNVLFGGAGAKYQAGWRAVRRSWNRFCRRRTRAAPAAHPSPRAPRNCCPATARCYDGPVWSSLASAS